MVFSRQERNNKMSSAKKALIENTENEQGVDSEQRENTVFQKDTKYSWFVCSCTFFTQIFVLGVLHAYGVFFVEFVKDFKASKGSTAWVGSLAYGLSMTLGPVTSQLLRRFSYSRVMMAGGVFCVLSLIISSFASSVSMLYITFSVLYGIGTCLCTTPTMTITPEYFDKYMSIATGITVSGSSFGTLIMGPLSQFIIDKAGWRTAFRIYAGFVVLTIILNSRIRQPPALTKRKAEGRSFIKDLQIWKNRVFVVWTSAVTLVMFGFYIPYVHLVSYAVDQGISQDMASFLVMILGATTAVGRIMFGKIVQYGVLNRLHMHQLSMVVTGTGVMVLPLIKSYTGIVLYVITVGLVDGCYVVLLPILTASLMGIEKSVVAWGFLIGTCSITFTIGPPIAGALFDATGNYNVAFHCAGIPIVAGAAILFLIPWAQRTSRGANILSAITEITFQASSQDGTGVYRTDSTGTICADEKLVETVNIGSKSNVAVQTTGQSPMSIRYTDKSTSTEEISLQKISLDMADAISQLSYTSQVFDEMLHRSLGSSLSQRASSSDSSEIPRIPPPSEPIHVRRNVDDRDGDSSARSYSSHISAASHLSGISDQIADLGASQTSGSSRSRQMEGVGATSGIPYILPAPAERIESKSSLHPSNLSVPSDHSAFRSTSVSGSVHSLAAASNSIHSADPSVGLPSASQLFALSDDPLQPFKPKQISPRQEQVTGSHSNISGDVAKQPSNFDQTISAQVNILRDTLKSPTSCSSTMDEVTGNVTGSVHSTCQNNSERVSIASSDDRNAEHLEISSAPTTSNTNPFLPEETGPSRSELVQFLQEAISSEDGNLQENINMENSNKFVGTGSTCSVSDQCSGLADTKFDHDNQLTVIPATNPFDSKKTNQSGSKLEDLFKPITEEDNLHTNSSYEVLDTESGEQVQKTRSQISELDVFTHLFQDDDT